MSQSLDEERAYYQEMQAQAESLRNRAHMQEIGCAVRSMMEQAVDDVEELRSKFIRIIRDGVAEQINSAILETRRIMDQHHKLRRLSSTSRGWNEEFQQLADQFLQKKILLEKMERALGKQRSAANVAYVEEDRARLNRTLENTRKLRKIVVELAEKLIQTYQRLDTQIRKDRDLENGLEETLQKCMAHLPAGQRRKIRVLIQQKTENIGVEDRIRFYSRLVAHLAQAVPAIRDGEISRLMRQAYATYDQLKYRETIQVLDQLFQLDKKNLKAHRLRAKTYLALKNRVAYICELRMITEIENAEADDFVVLAEILAEDGQVDDAVLLYEQAAERDLEGKYLLAWADLLSRRGIWYKAAQVYERILKKKPDDVSIRHKLGRAYYETSREEEAFAILRRAIDEQDGVSHSHVCVGRIYRKRQALNEAQRCFVRAVELDAGNAEAFYWWGAILCDLGRFDEALVKSRDAVLFEPKRARNLLLLARCLDAMGDSIEAVKMLEPLINVPNPAIDHILSFSEYCRHSNRYEPALDLLSNLLKRYPRQPLLRVEYGLLLLQTGSYGEAEEFLNPNLRV